jgi:cytochrome oxidase Cu insertion factor (SCO1/SenC/PrrC family)
MVRFPHISPRVRNLLLGLVSLTCLAFAAGVAYVLIAIPEAIETPIVGRFELTDSNGQRVTEQAYSGRYMLVYFGYTFCPDVCPTELAKMAAALDQFEEVDPARAEKVVPIFISVDPERDTTERLKDYIELFHPRLQTMTGTAEQLRAAAAAYKVYFAKVRPETGTPADPDYLIDHSSQIHLMGPDARYITLFTSSATAKDIADALAREVQ